MLVLTTLNSQYIHSNLALRYLSGVAAEMEYSHTVMEFTINEDIDSIVRRIYRRDPTEVAFSCYIWNINETIQVIKTLKKVSPKVKILVGGPEVSYDAVQLMRRNPDIDITVRGEGEDTFRELLLCWQSTGSLAEIDGITWRDGEQINENPYRQLIDDLGSIPLAYGYAPLDLDGRIIYYEASRGCPYNCSYCLSSTIRGVRYFPPERIRREIADLVKSGVHQVKFVDRSFNCNSDKALELMKYLARLPGQTNFHFEIVADILTPEMLEFLSEVPAGKFQFEIGIQSINPATLSSINRSADLVKTASNIKALKKLNNIHLHLDLIVGLPFEDYESISRSFNWVYDLGPDHFQLGFLKLLKGSAIRDQAEKHRMVFKDQPPYEILANRWLSYNHISQLKIIESLLNKYFNSGVFSSSLDYCVNHVFGHNAMMFYEKLADWWIKGKHDEKPVRRDKLYGILAEFITGYAPEHAENAAQLLMYDFVYSNPNQNVPEELNRFTITEQAMLIKNYLRSKVQDRSGRCRIEVFKIDVLNFVGHTEKNQDRPYYPVLFEWHEKRAAVKYIEL